VWSPGRQADAFLRFHADSCTINVIASSGRAGRAGADVHSAVDRLFRLDGD
jgi:hypothetical protein